MADSNIKVEKQSNKVTTNTKAITLDEEKQYQEIARLMGVSQNENGLNVAKELKQSCNNYKLSLTKK